MKSTYGVVPIRKKIKQSHSTNHFFYSAIVVSQFSVFHTFNQRLLKDYHDAELGHEFKTNKFVLGI